jgi:hypothetical protein
MRIRVLIATAVAASTLAAGGGIAAAKAGDVVRTGSCSAASTWKLKLSPEDSQIETQLEVDQNVVGQRWRVRLRHNGELVAVVTKTTQAPSGSFTLRRMLADAPGDDFVKARARNLATDELCVARATLRA